MSRCRYDCDDNNNTANDDDDNNGIIVDAFEVIDDESTDVNAWNKKMDTLNTDFVNMLL